MDMNMEMREEGSLGRFDGGVTIGLVCHTTPEERRGEELRGKYIYIYIYTYIYIYIYVFIYIYILQGGSGKYKPRFLTQPACF